jgi:hypothetical protein
MEPSRVVCHVLAHRHLQESAVTVERMQELCDGVCDAFRVSGLQLDEGYGGPVAFHLLRKGVTVDVMHYPRSAPDHIFLLVGLGELPLEDPRIGRIVLSLLEMNFQPAALQPPVVGRNPATGQIVLKCVFPLADVTPAAFVEAIDVCVDIALDWRRDFFQQEAMEDIDG